MNLLVGTSLITMVIVNFAKFGFLNPFTFAMTAFQGLFGVLIVASCFGAKFIINDYLFIMTGKGRGCFNIIVGLLIFITNPRTTVPEYLMGFLLLFSGMFILFLTLCTKASNDDILRAMSVNSSMKKSNSSMKFSNLKGTKNNDNHYTISHMKYNNQAKLNESLQSDNMSNNQNMSLLKEEGGGKKKN